MTCLPIIESQASDVTEHIPANIISMTDGQIFTSNDLADEGVWPPINIQLSTSRYGENVQYKALSYVSRIVRLQSAQYHEVADMGKSASGLDTSTQAKLVRGARIQRVLQQDRHEFISAEVQILDFYAVMNGFLDDIALENVPVFLRRLRDHLRSNSVLDNIVHSGYSLSKEDFGALSEYIRKFKEVS